MIHGWPFLVKEESNANECKERQYFLNDFELRK